MTKNIILNNIASKTIILMLSFFNTASASEPADYVRDYRGGDQRVIKANVTNTAGNDIVDNILTSLAHNNILFVCYSGYKFVPEWSRDGGNYRDKPLNPQHTNILTEIDLHTKIEHQFQTPKEIDDNLPVTDIIRWKDNYCVAHAHDIYVYHASYGWITSNKLIRRQHLHCSLSDADDVIKKIFVDSHNNILGVSAHGFIFKSPLTTTSTSPIGMQPIFNIFDSQEKQKIHCFGYHQQSNLLLFGCTGSIKAVDLNSTPPKLCTIKTAPNLSINTIDTNDILLLFSNTIQNPHINWCYYNGHLKKDEKIPCCIEKNIPYDQWQDCESCTKAQKEWNETSISLTITASCKFFEIESKSMFEKHYPKPKSCTHKIAPCNQEALPDSCLNTTILLVTIETLLQNMQKNATECVMDNLNPLKKSHRSSNEISNEGPFITNISMNNDFLLIDTISKNDGQDIYKFPLYSLKDSNESLDIGKCYNSSDKKTRYLHHRYDSTNFNDSERYRAIKINKSPENEHKLVLSRILASCSMWHQISCPDGDHHFRYVADIMTFVKKNTPFDIRQNALIISLKRTLFYLARYAKIKISLLIFAAYIAYTYAC